MTAEPPKTAGPVVPLRTPADLISAVPYLLGFHPADSVVVLALMWNGSVKCEYGIAVVCPVRFVVGPVLGAGRSVPCLARRQDHGWGVRVKDRRSRSRSDAGGVLDAGTQEWMIEGRGGEVFAVVGSWW